MAKALERLYQWFNTIIAAVLLVGVLAVVILATTSFLQLTGETVIGSPTDVSYEQLQRLFDLLLGRSSRWSLPIPCT